ncbi:unnamed protein product [Mortierella alpina]
MAIKGFGYSATATLSVAISQHARHILFAGWTCQVAENKDGSLEIRGMHSREEASIVQKYRDHSLDRSTMDGSARPKFYGWGSLQGVCLPLGDGIIALYPCSSPDAGVVLSGSDQEEQPLVLSEPRLVPGRAKDVAACGWSKDHWTVVVDDSGRLFQWSDVDPAKNPVPQAVASAQRPEVVYTRVWAGEAHMLALDTEGTLYSWGSGRYGQLGHGDLSSLSAPKAIEALQGIRISSAACGASFSVAVSDSGDVYTFGLNDHGQLGIGKRPTASHGGRDEPLPVRNTALPQLVDFYEEGSDEPLEVTIVSVACGSAHTVALDDQGHAWSCGWRKYGQLSEPVQSDEEDQQRAFERLLSSSGGITLADQFLFRRMVLDDDWTVKGLCCGPWTTFVHGG